MKRTSTHLRRLTVGGAAVALGTLAGFTPAFADSNNDYVALGDSYSAGDGGGSYIADGTKCLRSPKSYAGQLAASKGLSLDLQACSGAVVSDLDKQYSALSPNTDYVTLTIGGNDVGFVSVVTECAKPSWWGNCGKAVDGANSKIDNELPSRLTTAYAEIKKRAPKAKIVVAGYPKLFNGKDCSAATFFSDDEMTKMNQTADRLNGQISKAVSKAGLSFADVRQPFTGHAVCDSSPYLHNVSLNVPESFHPNVAGYAAYANAISPKLGNPGTSMAANSANAAGTVVVSDASGTKKAQARLGADTSSDTSRSKAYAPDLNSAEARAAARRAGVSDAELTQLSQGQSKALKGEPVSASEKQALARAKG